MDDFLAINSSGVLAPATFSSGLTFNRSAMTVSFSIASSGAQSALPVGTSLQMWDATGSLRTIPVQLQSDWSQAITGAADYIKNKPTIPAAQVQVDWSQSSSGAVDYIKNKPTIPAVQIQADWGQSNTSASDYVKNKPTIPSAQIQADWGQGSSGSLDFIKNKPTIKTMASARLQTDASGNLTWTYGITFSAAPIIAVVAEGNSTTIYNAQVISRTTTQCVIKVLGASNIVVSLVNVLGAATGIQAYVHLIALEP